MFKRFTNSLIRFKNHLKASQVKHPVVYTILGGTAIVLLWKGIWDTADAIPFLDGPVLIIISLSVLLISGLFFSFFAGERNLISNIKTEERLTKETEKEVRIEKETLEEVKKKLEHIDKDLHSQNRSEN